MNKPLHPVISDSELFEIETVMHRAAILEQKELSRINKLYNRFNYINKPKGNGETQCVVCGTRFNFTCSPKVCNMCLKVKYFLNFFDI